MANTKPVAAGPGGEVIKRKAREQFIAVLELEADVTEEDSRSRNLEISGSIVDKMLEAETLEDAIAASENGAASGKDMVDVELSVTDFNVKKSDGKYQASTPLGYFLEIDATRLDTGEQVAFSTGAPNVVTLLWKARQLERLPLECVIRGKDTANGTLLTLKLLTPRAVKG